MQDPVEDSANCNSASEQPGKDMDGEELKGVNDMEGDRSSESEYCNRIPQAFNGHCGEVGSRRIPYAMEGDGVIPFPPESPLHRNPNSRLRSPLNPAGSFDTHHGRRYGLIAEYFAFPYTFCY